MGFSHLSSLAFCAPHALPSRCLAAHTEMDLFGPSHDMFSCRHCNATKLHHLASLAREIDISDFKRVLYSYQHLLGEYDKNGNSCVHFAAGSGASLAHLAVLADEGAPMELVNNDGQTFLHVLNTKLYSPETLAQIIGWAKALLTKGAMTNRDPHQRTVWHTLFQRGLKLDTFRSILPYLERNKDDMMILDCENHTPLDCLRSSWTLAGEDAAVDYLNMLQATRKLPLGYAVNRTLPLDNVLDQTKTYPESHTSSVSPAMPGLTDEIRNISIRTSSKGYGVKNLPTRGVGGVLSSYVNGRPLNCTAGLLSTGPSLANGWPRAFSPLPTNTPEKARRLLGP